MFWRIGIDSRFYNNKNKTIYIMMQLLPIHVVKMSTEKINELKITTNEFQRIMTVNNIIIIATLFVKNND